MVAVSAPHAYTAVGKALRSGSVGVDSRECSWIQTGDWRQANPSGTDEAKATRVVIAIFGVLAGLAGIEHGIGEINQGSIRPATLIIESWPDASALGHSWR
jgi:hypothetical protein